MLKSLFFKRGLWRTYLFSFIAVFLTCCIILISSFYFLAEKLIKEEMAQFSLNMANQVKDVMDMRIEELYNMAYQLSLEARIQGFLYEKGPLEVADFLSISEISKLLSKYFSANGFVTTIAVYYPNSASVISSGGYFTVNDFFKTFAGYRNTPMEDFLEILRSPNYKRILPLEPIAGDYNLNGEYITYIQSLPLGDKTPSATILFFVDKNALLNMMAKHMPEETGQVQIFTTDWKLIASKEDLDIPYVERLKGFIDSMAKTFFIEDSDKSKNMVVSYAVSQSVNWYYVSGLSLKFTIRKMQYIRNLTAIIAVISCTVGTIMSWFLAKFNYSPWKSLMKHIEELSSKKVGNSVNNEYLYVKDAIQVILSEREMMQSAFEKNKKYAKHYLLQKLCEGEAISKEDLEDNRIEFPYELFSVAAIKAKEETGELQEKFYSLAPGMEDVQDGYRISSFYHQNKILYIIINVDRETTERQNLYEISEELKRKAEGLISEAVVMGVGTLGQGADSLGKSFREAGDALQYSILNEDNTIVYYEELPKLTEELLDLSMDFKRRLYNCLKRGDNEEVESLLDLCLSQLMRQNRIPVCDVHYLYYNLINTAIQVCSDMQIGLEEGLGDRKEELLSIYEYRNVSDLIKNLYAVYSNLCGYILKENEKEKNSLGEQIELYIGEHFRDESLCSAKVAEVLNISISYLSRYMSKTFGMGFGDYLNKIRVEHAKKLLECSSKTINEIANEVGYASPSSFIRTFKRIEGITPGQFKVEDNSQQLPMKD